MATKKQKREAAERRRAEFMAEIKASGLAAQKADQERRRRLAEAEIGETKKVSQKERSILFDKGINPRTGVLFTDEEIEGMRKRANTPERKHLLKRIEAGRAGALNEQPPLNMSDYSAEADAYGFGGMTVGEFREKTDQNFEAFLREMRNPQRVIDELVVLEKTPLTSLVPPFSAAEEIYGMRRRGEQRTENG